MVGVLIPRRPLTQLRQLGFRTLFLPTTYAGDAGRWHYRSSGSSRLTDSLPANRRTQRNADGLDSLASITLSRRADDERFFIDGKGQLLQFVQVI